MVSLDKGGSPPTAVALWGDSDSDGGDTQEIMWLKSDYFWGNDDKNEDGGVAVQLSSYSPSRRLCFFQKNVGHDIQTERSQRRNKLNKENLPPINAKQEEVQEETDGEEYVRLPVLVVPEEYKEIELSDYDIAVRKRNKRRYGGAINIRKKIQKKRQKEEERWSLEDIHQREKEGDQQHYATDGGSPSPAMNEYHSKDNTDQYPVSSLRDANASTQDKYDMTVLKQCKTLTEGNITLPLVNNSELTTSSLAKVEDNDKTFVRVSQMPSDKTKTNISAGTSIKKSSVQNRSDFSRAVENVKQNVHREMNDNITAITETNKTLSKGSEIKQTTMLAILTGNDIEPTTSDELKDEKLESSRNLIDSDMNHENTKSSRKLAINDKNHRNTEFPQKLTTNDMNHENTASSQKLITNMNHENTASSQRLTTNAVNHEHIASSQKLTSNDVKHENSASSQKLTSNDVKHENIASSQKLTSNDVKHENSASSQRLTTNAVNHEHIASSQKLTSNDVKHENSASSQKLTSNDVKHENIASSQKLTSNDVKHENSASSQKLTTNDMNHENIASSQKLTSNDVKHENSASSQKLTTNDVKHENSASSQKLTMIDMNNENTIDSSKLTTKDRTDDTCNTASTENLTTFNKNHGNRVHAGEITIITRGRERQSKIKFSQSSTNLIPRKVVNNRNTDKNAPSINNSCGEQFQEKHRKPRDRGSYSKRFQEFKNKWIYRNSVFSHVGFVDSDTEDESDDSLSLSDESESDDDDENSDESESASTDDDEEDDGGRNCRKRPQGNRIITRKKCVTNPSTTKLTIESKAFTRTSKKNVTKSVKWAVKLVKIRYYQRDAKRCTSD